MNRYAFLSIVAVVAILSLLAIAGCLNVAVAADLTVNLVPTTTGTPDAVSMEIDDVPNDLTPYPPAGYVYSGRIAPEPTQWVRYGLVVARWGGKSQPIKLRVTQLTPPTLKLYVCNYAYSPDKGTLDFIDDGKADLSSYLTRYFVARDVYGRINNPHEVKYRALRLWYDAAYKLSSKYRYIAIDEDVIQKATQVELDAQTNSLIAGLLKKVNGSVDYFAANNRQFKALYYDEIADVERLAASGHVEAAQIVNDYYAGQLAALPDAERRDVLKIHRLAPDTLSKNADYFANIRTAPARNITSMFPANRGS